MRVLLVEDDAELVEELRTELRGAGYAVETAGDGIDGEHWGVEEDFDAVILDLGLPGRPGLEVLRRWRSSGRSMPVLILTARDAWHERVDGLKAGADDYLGKPASLPVPGCRHPCRGASRWTRSAGKQSPRRENG